MPWKSFTPTTTVDETHVGNRLQAAPRHSGAGPRLSLTTGHQWKSAESWNISAELPRKLSWPDSAGVNFQPRLGTTPGEKPR
jgi:hypothetical protein